MAFDTELGIQPCIPMDSRSCWHACRNNPYPRSNNRVRIKPKPGGIRPYQKLGNKSSGVAYELPISEVPINQWIHFTVEIKYSSYDMESNKALTSGHVKVWMNGKQIADWKGDVGKNDEKGPYFI